MAGTIYPKVPFVHFSTPPPNVGDTLPCQNSTLGVSLCTVLLLLLNVTLGVPLCTT